jgi:Rhodopirellula transposase DDE domain
MSEAKKIKEAGVAQRFCSVGGSLNERSRRLFVASEARSFGYGGIAAVSRATGVARRTIGVGLEELEAIEAGTAEPLDAMRIRRPGAGRPRTTDRDPTLLPDLRELAESTTRGDPMSPLLWTARSQRNLVAELTKQGHKTSTKMVARLLEELGYSLQGNSKRSEGAQHPDRNAQFENINEKVRQQLGKHGPVISVDTKKKELVGNFKNAGRELRPQGQPETVKVHDFVDPELGRVAPYGVYDLGKNEAWVSVGVNHDTGEFAVEAIRTWWKEMGLALYASAASLLITADGGGSNGYRLRLWKVELQKLADEIRIPISVSHLPPGTSKWNKVEHRLFSFITQNWRGKPLVTHQVIVDLISATTTKAGLKVKARIDPRCYPTGKRVSNAELANVHLVPDQFHGEWNYTICPTTSVNEIR